MTDERFIAIRLVANYAALNPVDLAQRTFSAVAISQGRSLLHRFKLIATRN
jgi:hypothetical protein